MIVKNILNKKTKKKNFIDNTGILPFDSDILLKTILDNVPEKFKDINKKAFQGGFDTIKSMKK